MGCKVSADKMSLTEPMKQLNQSRKETENFNSNIGNSALTRSNKQKIDKAKAEVKILKKFINNSQTEYGNNDKRIK
ncbi:MAG: hypothetical protein ACE5D0_04290 [Fidelibacterota bacterium]